MGNIIYTRDICHMIQALMIQTDIEWKYLDDNRIFIIPIISIFDIFIMLDKNLFTMNILSTIMLYIFLVENATLQNDSRPFSATHFCKIRINY